MAADIFSGMMLISAATMWIEWFRTRRLTKDLEHLRNATKVIRDLPEPLRSQEHERIMKAVYTNHLLFTYGPFTIDGWRRTY